MIKKKHIKITVKIIVKKSGLCAEAGKIQPVFQGFILIVRNTIFVDAFANQKLIFTGHGGGVSYPANINIQQTVCIYIRHRDSRSPPSIIRYSSLCSNIFKVHGSFVQVKPVLFLVGTKKEIDFFIIIKIPAADTTTIIKIYVFEKVKIFVVSKIVTELEPCCFTF